MLPCVRLVVVASVHSLRQLVCHMRHCVRRLLSPCMVKIDVPYRID